MLCVVYKIFESRAHDSIYETKRHVLNYVQHSPDQVAAPVSLKAKACNASRNRNPKRRLIELVNNDTSSTLIENPASAGWARTISARFKRSIEERAKFFRGRSTAARTSPKRNNSQRERSKRRRRRKRRVATSGGCSLAMRLAA